VTTVVFSDSSLNVLRLGDRGMVLGVGPGAAAAALHTYLEFITVNPVTQTP